MRDRPSPAGRYSVRQPILGSHERELSTDEMFAEAQLISAALRSLGVAPPILVGGFAVELYLGGGYTSSDIDMVSSATSAEISEALTPLGYERASDRRHWFNEAKGVLVEFPSSQLEGDETRCRMLGKVKVISVEDLLIDRLRAALSWKDRSSYEQAAALIGRYRAELDFDYCRGRLDAFGEIPMLERLLAALEWKRP